MIHTKFKAIVFDFDGVILDSEHLHYKAYCPVFDKIGLAITYEEYAAENYIGLSGKQIFSQLLFNKGYRFSTKKINDLFNMKIECYCDIVQHTYSLLLIKDIRQYCAQILKDGNKLAICTGMAKQEINFVLAKLNSHRLLPSFHTIVSADDVRNAKPSPEGYLLAAERLQVSPKECLVIEDSPHGVEAAKRAGMYTAAILTTHEKHQLTKADKIISSFADLLGATDNEDFVANSNSLD